MIQDGGLGLLVVDDEPFILREIVRALSRRWSTVLQANSAAEAALLVGAHAAIGVLVTDIRMPGEDGLRLASRLFAARPEAEALEVVLISGHAMPRDLAGASPGVLTEFIQKPFRLTELEAAVTRAHGRAQARRDASRGVGART
jgi:DNA-binding NtrC family response regulator